MTNKRNYRYEELSTTTYLQIIINNQSQSFYEKDSDYADDADDGIERVVSASPWREDGERMVYSRVQSRRAPWH